MEYNKKIDNYGLFEETSEGTTTEERLKDVVITYYSGTQYFANSPQYKRIPEEKVERVKYKLFDYTCYNHNQERIADVIPFITIVSEVEKIFLREK